MTPRDLQLDRCTEAFQGHGILPPLKTAALNHVGLAYERNIKRVYGLVLFPPFAITAALAHGRIAAEVRSRMKGKSEADIAQEESRQRGMHDLKRLRILSKNDKAARALRQHELQTAFNILDRSAYSANDGAEAWLDAQITATWTAFEAMAGDLWEAALNCKPKGLADLPGKRPPPQDERRILLKWLYANDYDLSHLMGTVLKEEQYKFESLAQIRKAYLDAFPAVAIDVHEPLASEALDALAAMRNVIVHNGGVIDKEFQNAKGVPPEAMGPLNSAIKIDGALVAKIVGPVLRIGHKLLVEVDQWIATH